MATTGERAADTDQVLLSVPPDPQSVATARLFIAATARHFGFDDHAVEDIRLAISEAVTTAVHAHQRAKTSDRIEIAVEPSDATIAIEVRDRVPAGKNAAAEGLDGAMLPLAIIRSVFPSTTLVPGEGGTIIRIELERPPYKAGE